MYGEGDYFMIAGLKAVAWDELNNLLFHSDQLELDFPEVVKEVYSSRGSHEELKSLFLTRILDYSDELYLKVEQELLKAAPNFCLDLCWGIIKRLKDKKISLYHSDAS